MYCRFSNKDRESRKAFSLHTCLSKVFLEIKLSFSLPILYQKYVYTCVSSPCNCDILSHEKICAGLKCFLSLFPLELTI